MRCDGRSIETCPGHRHDPLFWHPCPTSVLDFTQAKVGETNRQCISFADSLPPLLHWASLALKRTLRSDCHVLSSPFPCATCHEIGLPCLLSSFGYLLWSYFFPFFSPFLLIFFFSFLLRFTWNEFSLPELAEAKLEPPSRATHRIAHGSFELELESSLFIENKKRNLLPYSELGLNFETKE